MKSYYLPNRPQVFSTCAPLVIIIMHIIELFRHIEHTLLPLLPIHTLLSLTLVCSQISSSTRKYISFISSLSNISLTTQRYPNTASSIFQMRISSTTSNTTLLIVSLFHSTSPSPLLLPSLTYNVII